MSKAYREETGDIGVSRTSQEMRVFCQRPGNLDEFGLPIYFTEQSHKKECDVNHIISKYDQNGIITHVSKFEGQFGDVTGVDFKIMQDKVAGAKTLFNQLPSKIRNEFENDPQKLLSFMDDPKNRDKAIKLGLINKDWTEDSDGIGEHVKEGKNIKKPDKPLPKEKEVTPPPG